MADYRAVEIADYVWRLERRVLWFWWRVAYFLGGREFARSTVERAQRGVVHVVPPSRVRRIVYPEVER